MAAGVVAATAEACGSSPTPVQISPDSGVTEVHPDTGAPPNDASKGPDTSTADAARDSGMTNTDAATDAPFDSGPDTAPPLDSGPPPPVCSPDANFGNDGGTLVLGTPNPDLMGGVSNDGLVIAWTSVPEDDAGTTPTVHWAERAQTSDSFGAAQTLDSKFGPIAPDHVALGGDGLRLVFASADRTRIYEVGRSAYGTPFEDDDTNENFEGVNPSTEGTTTTSGLGPFGSPSLASTLTTSWAFVQGTAGFVVSQNVLGVWELPAWAPSLSPPASDRFKTLPTGWSADGLTLFYWDNATGVERAAWRERSTLDFVSATTIGTTQEYAIPSADCTQLYFSAPGTNGDLDLFVSPIQ
jgi:hypothetical protein